MVSELELSLKDEIISLKDEIISLKDDNAALKDDIATLKDENVSLRDKVDAMTTSQRLTQIKTRSATDEPFDRAWGASQPSIKYVKWELTLNVQYHYNHTSPNKKLIESSVSSASTFVGY